MKKSKIKLPFNLFLFLVFLFSFFTFHHQIDRTHYQEGDACIIGTITQVHQIASGYSFHLQAKETILVFSDTLSNQLGDQIQVCGTVTKPKTNTNFHLFSYRNYLLSQKITWQMDAEEIKLIKKNASFFYGIKQKLENYLDTYQSASYLKTFVLGDSSFLEQKDLYQQLGISHLFSVSGMHVHFLTSTLYGLFRSKERKKIKDILVLGVLFFYAWLTGFSPSILRATFLFCFCTFKKWCSISCPNHAFLVVLFLLFVWYNPYLLYHSGFLYSFSISFFLLYYQKELENKSFWKKLVLTSTIAFVVGIPISLVFQFELNPLSIFYNLIFVPFVSFLLFPFCFLVLIFPFLDPILCFLISFLETVAFFFQKFHFTFLLGYPSYLLLVYVLACSIAIKGVLYKKMIFLVPLFVCLLVHFCLPYFDRNGYVTMLDVGQGDSILLELPYRKGVVLIDTGGNVFQKENTIGKNILIPYLKQKGIRKLSTLVISHGDYDHMGEAIYLVEHFKVGNVILNCGEFDDLEKELIKVLEKKNIKYYSCIKELNIDNNKLYFLQTKEYDNENDNSNVIYTEIDGYKFMLMGDAGIEKEKDILDKYNISNVDVLKVGHHGSKTSSSKTFIAEINPKYSMISVGKNNRYGHPNDNVLDNLKESKIYRTDQDGSVMFKITNNKLKIETCAP